MAVKSSTSRITATTRLTRDAMGVIALFRKSAPWLQRIAVLIDIVLLWILWPRHRYAPRAWRGQRPSWRPRFGRFCPRRQSRSGCPSGMISAALGAARPHSTATTARRAPEGVRHIRDHEAGFTALRARALCHRLLQQARHLRAMMVWTAPTASFVPE
jgi:hypothetical protein